MGYVLIIVFILIGLIFIVYYNILIKKVNGIKNALSSLDVMFKRRNDLIPNLNSCVKGYMHYEEECLKKINLLRRGFQEDDLHKTFDDSNEMSKALKEFFGVVENYPELKASDQFLKLEKALYDMEEVISAGRRTYNAHVTSYNTFISYFPHLIFAKILGFKEYPLFKFKEKENKL